MVATPREALNELMKVYRDQAQYLERADRYYRAEPSSVTIGSRIPPALAKYRTAWPAVRIATNAFADRVTLEDVHYADAPDEVSRFRDDLSASLNQAILEALATGIGYIRTVVLDQDHVTFTAHRGRDGAYLEDPDTGEITATMRVHRPRDYKGLISNPQRVTVYVPGGFETFSINPKPFRRPGEDYWTSDPAGSGTVPNNGLLMRPLVNRARASEPYGRPEGRDLYQLQDQGSRNLTNLSIVGDSLAVPQRVLIAALPESISDLSVIQAYTDSILALSGDVKIDQWQAAQMQPFTDTAMTLGRKASEASGIPLSYWGIASEANGASGDSIRENDARMEIRSGEIGAQFTKPVVAIGEDVAALLRINSGRVTASWRDPATPTPTAAADAALKMAQIGMVNGQIVIDREMIWNILRIPPEDRQRIRELEESNFFQDLMRQQAAEQKPPEGTSDTGGSTGNPTNSV